MNIIETPNYCKYVYFASLNLNPLEENMVRRITGDIKCYILKSEDDMYYYSLQYNIPWITQTADSQNTYWHYNTISRLQSIQSASWKGTIDINSLDITIERAFIVRDTYPGRGENLKLIPVPQSIFYDRMREFTNSNRELQTLAHQFAQQYDLGDIPEDYDISSSTPHNPPPANNDMSSSAPPPPLSPRTKYKNKRILKKCPSCRVKSVINFGNLIYPEDRLCLCCCSSDNKLCVMKCGHANVCVECIIKLK